MSRRPPITSPDEINRIAAASSRKIEAPIPLDEQAKKFFSELIDEKAKGDWTDHEVSCAAILARAMSEVVADPQQRAITQKLNAIIAMRRSLGIHSVAAGESHNNQRRRELAKQIENKILENTEDELISRPTWQ